MDRYEAREAIVEWFRRETLLAEVKPYRHSVGHSYRSHVAIEPYLSDQWYVRVSDDRMAGAALRAMNTKQRRTRDSQCVWKDEGEPTFDDRGSAWEGGLNFYPVRYARTFQTWHENIRDWCISRQLWWGHRIPVWSKTIGEDGAPGEIGHAAAVDALDALAGSLPGAGAILADDEAVTEIQDDHRWSARAFGNAIFICLRNPDEDVEAVTAVERLGFTRDPDVLDTWFSSALWPLSTMGWPSPNAFANEDLDGLLDTFNPTDLLCTAREIITLWVSRMVMFNTYFLDRLPFRDVFIHAMIQDGEGRKMSKSLGNGVDPRDIIRSKGADAMRFTLAHMTTQTQDVRLPVEYDEELGGNTSPKFELGRRLGNKLWNATRFALGTLSKVEGTGDPDALPNRLIDRWMMSRLARVGHDIEKSINEYQFNNYAQTLYDLFWRDFCDWYLEGIKPTIQSDPVQQSVLRAALTAIHRYFQPVMPFIAETLHEAIEEIPVRPSTVAGIELGAPLASTAAWPRPEASLIDARAEAIFEEIRTLINAVREVRSLQKVNDRREITLHIADRPTMDLIEHAQDAVKAIAGIGVITRDAPADDVEAVRFLFNGEEHALSDLREAVDVDAELERLTKRRDELQKQIKNFEKRLSNESYVQKAPQHLVEETRKQLVDAGTELDNVLASLKRIGG
ncbi:MAG: class I tRNA ligase family protein, partial [Planctomycetota bacterium]